MKSAIIYKDHIKMLMGIDFFNHYFRKQIKYFNKDKKIFEWVNGDTIHFIKFEPNKFRGTEWNLVIIDKNITIEELYNEIYNRYEEARFF